MSESQSKPTLNQLIDEAHEGSIRQQAATAPTAPVAPAQFSFKAIVAFLLLVALAFTLYAQFPRMQAPYAWPDVQSSSAMAEADLEAVASLIEVYKLSQGQYPAVLSQVALPGGLAALVASSVLVYNPSDGAFTLDWTLSHWHATFDSRSGKTVVEPVVKR